jgi:hypothetical protein
MPTLLGVVAFQLDADAASRQLRRIKVVTEWGDAALPAPAPIIDGAVCAGKVAPTLDARTTSVPGELSQRNPEHE